MSFCDGFGVRGSSKAHQNGDVAPVATRIVRIPRALDKRVDSGAIRRVCVELKKKKKKLGETERFDSSVAVDK